MPYLKEGRKKEVKAERKRANTDGDYNYLYTVEYLEAFTANPSYGTIAQIVKASIEPHKLAGVEALEEFLTVNAVSLIDRKAARLAALLEFYARIGRKYEKECIVTNGDLDEYKRAELAIQEKFAVAK